MIRTIRTIVAVAGLVCGLELLHAGWWFLGEAGDTGDASQALLAGGVSVMLPGAMLALAVMGLGLGLMLLFLSGREMFRLWRSRPGAR
jgi:hypothetical protein